MILVFGCMLNFGWAGEGGAQIVTSAKVLQLMIEDSRRANGVLLADGIKVCSSILMN